jgi:hypothetical protein
VIFFFASIYVFQALRKMTGELTAEAGRPTRRDPRQGASVFHESNDLPGLSKSIVHEILRSIRQEYDAVMDPASSNGTPDILQHEYALIVSIIKIPAKNTNSWAAVGT